MAGMMVTIEDQTIGSNFVNNGSTPKMFASRNTEMSQASFICNSSGNLSTSSSTKDENVMVAGTTVLRSEGVTSQDASRQYKTTSLKSMKLLSDKVGKVCYPDNLKACKPNSLVVEFTSQPENTRQVNQKSELDAESGKSDKSLRMIGDLSEVENCVASTQHHYNLLSTSSPSHI